MDAGCLGEHAVHIEQYSVIVARDERDNGSEAAHVPMKFSHASRISTTLVTGFHAFASAGNNRRHRISAGTNESNGHARPRFLRSANRLDQARLASSRCSMKQVRIANHLSTASALWHNALDACVS